MIVANKPLPSYPLPQRREALPVTAKPKKPKYSIRPVARLGVVLLVMVALSFTLVARQAQIVAKNRNIGRLQNAIAELETANAALQRDVASLSSSSRIEQIAKTQLGMAKPTDSQIMKVGVSGGN